MATPACSAARFRGSVVGAFTASLAAAAHGVATGTMPTGGAVALLAVLAVGIGTMTSASDRAGEAPVLIGVLAAGQLGGHLVLGSGHNHGPAAGSVAVPAHLMLLAHLAAVILGAALVVAGERLFTSLSSAIRSRSQPPRAYVPGRPAHVLPVADHPLRRDLLIAASISHRGPPAGFTR